jgi:hypothetical protein
MGVAQLDPCAGGLGGAGWYADQGGNWPKAGAGGCRAYEVDASGDTDRVMMDKREGYIACADVFRLAITKMPRPDQIEMGTTRSCEDVGAHRFLYECRGQL